MIKFYFQYDKERHKAKVVLDGDPNAIEIFYTGELVCEVPVKSVLSDVSPQFIMRGECVHIKYNSKSMTLTNKR